MESFRFPLFSTETPSPPVNNGIPWSSDISNRALTQKHPAASPPTATAAHLSIQMDADGVTPCLPTLENLINIPAGVAVLDDDLPAPLPTTTETARDLEEKSAMIADFSMPQFRPLEPPVPRLSAAQWVTRGQLPTRDPWKLWVDKEWIWHSSTFELLAVVAPLPKQVVKQATSLVVGSANNSAMQRKEARRDLLKRAANLPPQSSAYKTKYVNRMEAGLSRFYRQALNQELEKRIEDLVKQKALLCKLVTSICGSPEMALKHFSGTLVGANGQSSGPQCRSAEDDDDRAVTQVTDPVELPPEAPNTLR